MNLGHSWGESRVAGRSRFFDARIMRGRGVAPPGWPVLDDHAVPATRLVARRPAATRVRASVAARSRDRDRRRRDFDAAARAQARAVALPQGRLRASHALLQRSWGARGG